MGIYTCLLYLTFERGGGVCRHFTVPYLGGGGGGACLVYLTSGRLGAVFGVGFVVVVFLGGRGRREETGTPLV